MLPVFRFFKGNMPEKRLTKRLRGLWFDGFRVVSSFHFGARGDIISATVPVEVAERRADGIHGSHLSAAFFSDGFRVRAYLCSRGCCLNPSSLGWFFPPELHGGFPNLCLSASPSLFEFGFEPLVLVG